MNRTSHGMRPLLAAVALTLSSSAFGADSAAGGAKVNGTVIPAYRIDAAVKSRIAQGQADSPELRKGIRDALINQEVVAQEAVKRGLDKQPATAARIELDRQSALVNAYFEDYLKKNPISDDMLRKEYERLKPQVPAKEYRVRHILVEKEDDAKNIIAQIKKGGSFEKLAAEHSTDPGSKGRGGDLDWGPRGALCQTICRRRDQDEERPDDRCAGAHRFRLPRDPRRRRARDQDPELRGSEAPAPAGRAEPARAESDRGPAGESESRVTD